MGCWFIFWHDQELKAYKAHTIHAHKGMVIIYCCLRTLFPIFKTEQVCSADTHGSVPVLMGTTETVQQLLLQSRGER